MTDMYSKMKSKGINMEWYAKIKGINSKDIPLFDEECSRLSVYYVELDGSLWTIDAHGVKYKQVRKGQKPQPKAVYVCVHCKSQWNELVIHPEIEE